MVILFLVALFLAWPTAGLSIIAYVAFAVLRSYFGARVRMNEANITAARKAFAAGEKHAPSWIGDKGEREIFMEVVRQKAMKEGVPRSYVQGIFLNEESYMNYMYFAGSMEKQGASFTEQQVAVSDELVELWKIA